MNTTIVEATAEDNALIENLITDYNIQVRDQSIPRAKHTKIDLVIRDEQRLLVGGINADYVNWGIVFISILFIRDEYRGLGYGSQLLKRVEELAKEKGAYLAHLDTFEFQAKDFYLKQGYEIFGILEDCPKGYKRYYLKKRLTA